MGSWGCQYPDTHDVVVKHTTVRSPSFLLAFSKYACMQMIERMQEYTFDLHIESTPFTGCRTQLLVLHQATTAWHDQHQDSIDCRNLHRESASRSSTGSSSLGYRRLCSSQATSARYLNSCCFYWLHLFIQWSDRQLVECVNLCNMGEVCGS